ncbi:hypothetical protein [Actinoplanes sp. NPDC051851]|uniref:hypothetical protein n=1 Tax=Actinoplanes sp. NPDC051851 TaxID=3154753 RepID=UPI003425A92B
MALLVEIHVPRGGGPAGWIDEVEDYLEGLDDRGEVAVYDDGEEFNDAHVFFIHAASEEALLDAASQVAEMEGVPPGAWAMVTDDQLDETGGGRRVELPV